ncbi:MAG TPA: hypothetical protein VGG28_09995 [Kofleriaceae bacterium]
MSATAVGGGAATFDGDGGGFGGRVRVGIGDHQEVGIEASQVEVDPSRQDCNGDQCLDGNVPTATYNIRSRSALVEWKQSYGEHYALVAGLGGSEHAALSGNIDPEGDNYGHSLDASLAFIASAHINQAFDVYTGARAALAVPVGANNSQYATDVVGITGALGLATNMGEHMQLFVEGGAVATFTNILPELGVDAVAGLKLKL